VDLGVISKVKDLGNKILVYMTPTFSGCPAIELIAKEVREKTIQVSGYDDIEVIIDKESGWNTNMITSKGLQILNNFGLSPPKRYTGDLDVEVGLENATCPYCNKSNTAMRTPFGSTLCRSMHFCYDCNRVAIFINISPHR
jgi:ring-1,2-phenylacetyl-CoA epoxidase subunit PaaD